MFSIQLSVYRSIVLRLGVSFRLSALGFRVLRNPSTSHDSSRATATVLRIRLCIILGFVIWGLPFLPVSFYKAPHAAERFLYIGKRCGIAAAHIALSALAEG